jgi:hypothetical protein
MQGTVRYRDDWAAIKRFLGFDTQEDRPPKTRQGSGGSRRPSRRAVATTVRRSPSVVSGVLDHPAALDHQHDAVRVVEHRGVGQRVAGHRDQVG